jgi:hypothetical protein
MVDEIGRTPASRISPIRSIEERPRRATARVQPRATVGQAR